VSGWWARSSTGPTRVTRRSARATAITGLYAALFGRQYMTHYEPIKDGAGKVVGLAFVGVGLQRIYLKRLKDTIRAMKIGNSGYFYVLDARPGADFAATLSCTPHRKAKTFLDSKGSGRTGVHQGHP